MPTSSKNDLDSGDPVCHGCVHDHVLAQRIQDEGQEDACAICGEDAPCVTLSQIGDWLKAVLPYAIHSVDVYGRHAPSGDSLEYMIADLMQLPDEDGLAAALAGEISGLSYIDMKDGGDELFSATAEYIRTRPTTRRMRERWSQFEEGLRHKSRFFNSEAKAFLDILFADLPEIHSRGVPEWPPLVQDNQPTFPWESVAVLRMLKPGESWSIYRARLVDDEGQYRKFEAQTEKEFGPPPTALASSGRMNAQGVPVFYGASDRPTCIAELRPHIGASVATAEFRLTKPVTVLDLRILEDSVAESPLSIFDPDFFLDRERRHFLRSLHELVREPTRPGAALSYLSTQAIADYLTSIHRPPIQGILFSSVQRNQGANIVLFGPVATEPRVVELAEEPFAMMLDDFAESEDDSPSTDLLDAFSVALVEGSLEFHRVGGISYEVQRELRPGEHCEDFDDQEF